MQRRPFLKWLFSMLAALRLQRWARAGTVAAADEKALKELGSVVLPGSLGRARTDKIAADFAAWIRGYKAGVETSTGYGLTRIQPLPADPATSVCDSYGRTHDHEDLFVVGAPTLPNAGCTNGTLTFVALTLRSAEEIAWNVRG